MVKNNEVSSLGSNRANKIDEISAKSKKYQKFVKSQKFAKTKRLEESIFLNLKASSILFIKNSFN